MNIPSHIDVKIINTIMTTKKNKKSINNYNYISLMNQYINMLNKKYSQKQNKKKQNTKKIKNKKKQKK